jgi:hypothetical protein
MGSNEDDAEAESFANGLLALPAGCGLYAARSALMKLKSWSVFAACEYG